MILKRLNLKLPNLKTQRGDTIVEVLIAMSIMGMVLATAFSIANRSYAIGLSARERTEALQIAESQLELLNIASSTDGSNALDAITPGELFCLDSTTTTIDRISFNGTPGEIIGDIDPITSYDPGCQLGAGDRFKVSIEQDPSDVNIYSVRVRWESVLGGNIEEINHVYKIYDFDGAFSLGSQILTPPPPTTCEDPAALNLGGPLPCQYPANMNVVIRKIPPTASNQTPNCSRPATINRSGIRVNVNGVNRFTNSASTAIFTGLNPNTSYNITASNPPSGHQLCTTSTTQSTGADGTTVTNTTIKIRPICTYGITGYSPGYYQNIARRADLDGWYVTMVGFPTWNTQIIAGHWSAPGTFRYVYSGTNNPSNNSAYYRLWQVQWRVDPIYGWTCPT